MPRATSGRGTCRKRRSPVDSLRCSWHYSVPGITARVQQIVVSFDEGHGARALVVSACGTARCYMAHGVPDALAAQTLKLVTRVKVVERTTVAISRNGSNLCAARACPFFVRANVEDYSTCIANAYRRVPTKNEHAYTTEC